MLALHAKRGVESTLERVFQSTGGKLDELVFLWTGKTAGVSKQGRKTTVLMPSIDETADVSRDAYNNYIGYVLHELGHLWFTRDKPWDEALEEHGQWLGAIINGLEDPRIERRVIDSGYAPNASSLFERLLNAVLEKDGHVSPDDFKNIPFLLAIEGRRLNGYRINHPCLLTNNTWGNLLETALKKAHTATSTDRIVEISIELFLALKQEQESHQDRTEPRSDRSEASQGGDQEGLEGKGSVDSKEPSDQASNSGCLDGDMTGVREVEPNITHHIPQAGVGDRPAVIKPVFQKITYE
jgi:hypothetical protein